jgi:hypothetical protein
MSDLLSAICPAWSDHTQASVNSRVAESGLRECCGVRRVDRTTSKLERWERAFPRPRSCVLPQWRSPWRRDREQGCFVPFCSPPQHIEVHLWERACPRPRSCALPQWHFPRQPDQDQVRFDPACSRPESLLFASPNRSNQEKCDPTFAPPLLCNVGALRCSETGGRRVRATARRSCEAAELGHPWPQTSTPFPAGFLRYSALQTGPENQEQ